MGVTNYYCAGGEVYAERAGAASRIDYLKDALGSVTGTVEELGVLQNTYRHKPYGDQLAKTGTFADPKLLWIGTEGYRKTSLAHAGYYIRARHYSQEEAGWTTVDNLWPLEGAYVYALSSPVSFVDSSGYCTLYVGTTVSLEGYCLSNGNLPILPAAVKKTIRKNIPHPDPCSECGCKKCRPNGECHTYRTYKFVQRVSGGVPSASYDDRGWSPCLGSCPVPEGPYNWGPLFWGIIGEFPGGSSIGGLIGGAGAPGRPGPGWTQTHNPPRQYKCPGKGWQFTLQLSRDIQCYVCTDPIKLPCPPLRTGFEEEPAGGTVRPGVVQ